MVDAGSYPWMILAAQAEEQHRSAYRPALVLSPSAPITEPRLLAQGGWGPHVRAFVQEGARCRPSNTFFLPPSYSKKQGSLKLYLSCGILYWLDVCAASCIRSLIAVERT
jgi:hypothetical protein